MAFASQFLRRGPGARGEARRRSPGTETGADPRRFVAGPAPTGRRTRRLIGWKDPRGPEPGVIEPSGTPCSAPTAWWTLVGVGPGTLGAGAGSVPDDRLGRVELTKRGEPVAGSCRRIDNRLRCLAAARWPLRGAFSITTDESRQGRPLLPVVREARFVTPAPGLSSPVSTRTASVRPGPSRTWGYRQPLRRRPGDAPTPGGWNCCRPGSKARSRPSWSVGSSRAPGSSTGSWSISTAPGTQSAGARP